MTTLEQAAREALQTIIFKHTNVSTPLIRDIAEEYAEYRLRAALAAGQAQQNPWRQAINEALIASCLDCIGEYESPEAALARLVTWEKTIVLDPTVSSEAAALIERGRLEASK